MPQTEPTPTRTPELCRLNRFLVLLAGGWTVLFVASFVWNWAQQREHATALAREEARSRFNTDMAYRRWVIGLGGVYVPVTPDTPPNPYLAHVPERDIQTPSGKALTLVNSSYMTRQVNAFMDFANGPPDHITSLKPLRPENAADPWETQALKAFEAGSQEESDVEWHDRQPYLRLMRPMFMDTYCMKCHGIQGYREGDVRGGISVTVPMESYVAIARADLLFGGALRAVLWGTGLVGLVLGGRRLRRGILACEQAEAEQAALREQLHQSQKMEAVGQLAGGVAHDFNNVLTAVLLNLDFIESRLPADGMVKEAAATIRSAGEQAVGLTRSLLMFSRRLPAERKLVKIQDIAQAAARLLRRLLPASIDLVAEIEPEPPLWLNADATQLQQVILNLSINARDAMPNGGTLRIRLWTPDEGVARGAQVPTRVCLAVSDTGTGISEEHRPHLFEPFFSTKPHGQGTGLGLAIVAGIVQAHDGRVEVESEVGKGSTFTVTLPCVAPPESASPVAASASIPRGHGEAILLAEDHQYVRASLAAMLHGLGYEALQAADGLSAVQAGLAQREQIRLMILDVDLPGLAGPDCLRELRAEGVSVPAILISGRNDWSQADAAELGATVLRKPFKSDELAQIVARLLREKAGGGPSEAP